MFLSYSARLSLAACLLKTTEPESQRLSAVWGGEAAICE
jgi:hypothetical protein